MTDDFEVPARFSLTGEGCRNGIQQMEDGEEIVLYLHNQDPCDHPPGFPSHETTGATSAEDGRTNTEK